MTAITPDIMLSVFQAFLHAVMQAFMNASMKAGIVFAANIASAEQRGGVCSFRLSAPSHIQLPN